MEWPFIPFTVRVALSCYDPDNPDPEDQALLAKWCHYWHSPENRSMWASRLLERLEYEENLTMMTVTQWSQWEWSLYCRAGHAGTEEDAIDRVHAATKAKLLEDVEL